MVVWHTLYIYMLFPGLGELMVLTVCVHSSHAIPRNRTGYALPGDQESLPVPVDRQEPLKHISSCTQEFQHKPIMKGLQYCM